METIELNFGVHIDHYIAVNFSMLGKLIDSIGGLTLTVENEYYLTMEHPMTKEHYISFIAHVSGDRVQIVKWYPEQNPETRLPRIRRGKVYAYCNRHGLFEVAKV